MAASSKSTPNSPDRRQVARPISFIFTLYGDMVHRLSSDGSLWIGALIRLMSSFGVSAPAVRQAVSRMTRQGWLFARREGNRAFYSVTERGRRRIEELSPRIYGPVIDWDGKWRLISYAIGEAHRKRRERLRKELSALGWAQLSPTTWISPSDTLAAAREAAEATRTLDAVNLFTSEYRGPLSDRALLERCWNVGQFRIRRKREPAVRDARLPGTSETGGAASPAGERLR